MTDIELLKKVVEEQPVEQSSEQPIEQSSEQLPKIYIANKEMLDDASKEVFNFLDLNKDKIDRIIDLGSDKDPQFALYLARNYEDLQITHFRDTKTMGRIDIRHKKENLNYIFTKRKLKKDYFDIATAFLTLHEFPTRWRKPELEILYRCLKQNGKIVVIEYDLKWVQREKINEDDFMREIFTDSNERRVMQTEWNCMRTHTALGLEDYVKELKDVGFKEKFSEKYHIKTSWGIKPKLFVYVGEKS